jgi:hypothetical protein
MCLSGSGRCPVADYSKHGGERSCYVTIHFFLNFSGNMKTTVFWDVVTYSYVEIGRRFRCAYCLHDQDPDKIILCIRHLRLQLELCCPGKKKGERIVIIFSDRNINIFSTLCLILKLIICLAIGF